MRRLLDRVGWPERAALALLALWVTWSWVAALLAGRMPSLTSPYVLSPVVLVVGVVLGRLVATRVRVEVVVAGLVVVTTVLFLGVIWTDGPAKRPTAYANANAALAVQVIGLAGLAMLRADRARRVVLWLTTAGAVAVIAANSSKAAFVVAVPLLAAIALMSWRPARRAWWAVLTGAASIVGGDGRRRPPGGAASTGHRGSRGPWTLHVSPCGATRCRCGRPTPSLVVAPGRWRSTAPWAATPTRRLRTPLSSRWGPRRAGSVSPCSP